MNEPIISPWIFYVADVIRSVNIAINILTLFAIIAVVCAIYTHFKYEEFSNDAEIKSGQEDIWFAIKVFIVVAMLNVFIPSKDTFYKMIATSYVTPSNIEMIGDNVDKIADKIVDKINKVKR